jgi:hypothetical protein
MPIETKKIEKIINKYAPNRDISKDDEKMSSLKNDIKKICYNGYINPTEKLEKLDELVDSQDYKSYLNFKTEDEKSKFLRSN